MARKIKKNKAYTLIEILVAVAIFTVIVVAISGLFVSAIRSQIKVLASQRLLDQTSYVIEYISRALRMAKKELATSTDAACLKENNSVLYGDNYQIPMAWQIAGNENLGFGIRFINSKGECQEFFLEDKRIKEFRAGWSNPFPLSSKEIEISSLRFFLSGKSQINPDGSLENLQPRVTIFLEAISDEQKIKIQNTVSQRDLDILK